MAGFWQAFERGKEPRAYTFTETITYTTPDEPEEAGLLLAADLEPLTATSQEPVLMGFTYVGPNVDHHIADDFKVCVPLLGCATVYDFYAGFTLDWGLGLRLPTEVRADGPTADPMVAGSYYSGSSRLSGDNWAPSDYSAWSVAPEAGNEFVLRFAFFVGVKAKLFGVDICPGCYVEAFEDKSTSLWDTTCAGASFQLDGFELPIKEWDLWALAFGMGVVFTPQLAPDYVSAHWEAVSGTAASGAGNLTYGEPDQDVEFGGMKACLVSQDHNALVRLSDFRYRLKKFALDVGVYLNLEIFGQGAWHPDWTLASVNLTKLGGDGLGRHKQCDVLWNCSEVGPAPMSSLQDAGVGVERDQLDESTPGRHCNPRDGTFPTSRSAFGRTIRRAAGSASATRTMTLAPAMARTRAR